MRQDQAKLVAFFALYMDGAIPASAHQMRQSSSIILVGFVPLGIQCSRRVAGLQQHHRKTELRQLPISQGDTLPASWPSLSKRAVNGANAPKMIAGSVATLTSKTTEPSRLLTTQTAVRDVDVSSAAQSFMAGRPLRRIKIDPPPWCDNGFESAASCSSPITPPVVIGCSKSTHSYAFLRLFAPQPLLTPCIDNAHTSPHRTCDQHSPGGVHAFLRVQHFGRRMLFIRFVNRAVQAVWRSRHEDGSRQEIADIPRFAAPPGDAHRARGSLIGAPSRHAGRNSSANLLRRRSS